MDELERIEPWLKGIVASVSPAARRQLARQLANGLRRRQQERIARQQNPDGSAFEPRKVRDSRRGRIKARADMFKKLRTARHLRATSDQESVAVGFAGRAAMIARISQEGLLARVARSGPLYRYPIRRLLGWTHADRAWVAEEVAAFLGK